MQGICTHFSSAGAVSTNFMRRQLIYFHEVVAEALKHGIRFEIHHAANSTAALRMEETHLNMVRIGIALYGIDPRGFFRDVTTLKPVLSFKTQIIYLKTVPPNTPVGYERTYTTYRPTKVATLPVGYNDGYPFLLSNKAHVIVRGLRAPVIGGVTMDYTMIDVTDIPDVSVGDETILIGRDGAACVTAEELANLTGTIPYEITCLLGKRVRRVYLSGGVEEKILSHAGSETL
jgi:alanine racemase